MESDAEFTHGVVGRFQFLGSCWTLGLVPLRSWPHGLSDAAAYIIKGSALRRKRVSKLEVPGF